MERGGGGGEDVNQMSTPSTSNHSRPYDFCSDDIPTAQEMLTHLPKEGFLFLGILSLFTLITIVVFVEEIYFLSNRFRSPVGTILVLAVYPLFSLTSLLGVVVPRSGTAVDLIANGYLGVCLLNFGRLMTRYMGGSNRMWVEIKPDRKIIFHVLPCCCCCRCLPKASLRKPAYTIVQGLIQQVGLVRPLVALFALTLWTNGSYYPGKWAVWNAHVYLTILNMASTLTAVYGLIVTKTALEPDLGRSHLIVGKILSVQLALVSSILPNFIIGILVSNNVIKCTPLFPSKARGEEIYHAVLVLLMFPFGLIGRRFFRRSSDSLNIVEQRETERKEKILAFKMVDYTVLVETVI